MPFFGFQAYPNSCHDTYLVVIRHSGSYSHEYTYIAQDLYLRACLETSHSDARMNDAGRAQTTASVRVGCQTLTIIAK